MPSLVENMNFLFLGDFFGVADTSTVCMRGSDKA